VNELKHRLVVAVARQSGGRVGISLSGGLDSSVVACLADPEIPAFTGYYDEPGFSELHHARYVAGFSGREHFPVRITPEDFVRHFDGMREHVKPPIMGMGTFGQYMVARYAARYVDALMSGEGSDELFGGYARQVIVAGGIRPKGYEEYQLPDGYPTTLADALAYDYAKLPDLLAVDDQMCGAWGIEARAPFMDHSILDYALALPPSQRVGKNHLREAMRGTVPDAIIDRKDKMGFPSPLALWAQRDPVKSFVLDRIGYLPDPAKPWDRKWWIELVQA
jgi:asparagine synthetase B (glutamine-hydrolysing)